MDSETESGRGGVRCKVESIYEDAWRRVLLNRLIKNYGQVDNAYTLVEDLTSDTYERIVRHFRNAGYDESSQPEISGGFVLDAFDSSCVDHFRRAYGHYRARQWLRDLVGERVANFLYKHHCEKGWDDARICDALVKTSGSDEKLAQETLPDRSALMDALVQMRVNNECARRNAHRPIEADAPLGLSGAAGDSTDSLLNRAASPDPGPQQTLEVSQIESERTALVAQLLGLSEADGVSVYSGVESLLTEDEKFCLRIRLQAYRDLAGDSRISESKMAEMAGMKAHTFRRRCESGIEKVKSFIKSLENQG